MIKLTWNYLCISCQPIRIQYSNRPWNKNTIIHMTLIHMSINYVLWSKNLRVCKKQIHDYDVFKFKLLLSAKIQVLYQWYCFFQCLIWMNTVMHISSTIYKSKQNCFKWISWLDFDVKNNNRGYAFSLEDGLLWINLTQANGLKLIVFN